VPARELPLTVASLHCSMERIQPFIDGNVGSGDWY
jgi:Fic family protein